jgi:hypothetical protein
MSITGVPEDMASTDDGPNTGRPPKTVSYNSATAHTSMPELDEIVLAKLSLTVTQPNMTSRKDAESTANITDAKKIVLPLPPTIYQPKSQNSRIFNTHTTLDQAPFPWNRDPEINFVTQHSTHNQTKTESIAHGELHFHRKPHSSHHLFEDLQSSTLGPLDTLNSRHHAFSDPSYSTLAPLSKPRTRKYFHPEMPKADTE